EIGRSVDRIDIKDHLVIKLPLEQARIGRHRLLANDDVLGMGPGDRLGYRALRRLVGLGHKINGAGLGAHHALVELAKPGKDFRVRGIAKDARQTVDIHDSEPFAISAAKSNSLLSSMWLGLIL